MAIRLDQKMLTGFVREAQSYLPPIREGLAAYQQTPGAQARLAEVVGYVHIIKGAATMVGLAVLSQLTAYVAETLAEVSAEQGPLDTACASWLSHTVDQLERYLASLLQNDGQEQKIAEEIERSFRQRHAAPAILLADPDALPAAPAGVETAAPVAGEASEPAAAYPAPTLLPEAQEEAFDDLVEGLMAESDMPSAPVDLHDPAAQDLHAPAAPSTDRPLVNLGPLDALIAAIDCDVQRVYGTGTRPPAPAGGPLSERYVLFTLAGSRYAVAITHVVEIGSVPPITSVPNVPSWLCGVINLRGDIISVVDIRAFLGLAEAQPRDSQRLLVVQTTDETLVTSLLIDRVAGIVPLAATLAEAPSRSYTDRMLPYLRGVYEHEAQTLAVFDLERFLRSPELRQFE
ncbi:MAG: chemotaxis protein CheW [Candidatus Tectimicrobiota bacterium]